VAGLAVGPLLGAVLHPWTGARVLGGLGTAAAMAVHAGVARRAAGGTGLEAALFPLCGLLLAGVVLASTSVALWRGGIVWRGTFYPLSALRRGYVKRSDWPIERAVGWPTP
jgi:hypothetical protein